MGTENSILNDVLALYEKPVLERFADQMQKYTETGVLPPLAGEDVRGALQLQSDRLRKLELELYYKVKKCENDSRRSFSGKCWNDPVYHSEIHSHPYRLRTTFRKDGHSIYDRSKYKMLYETMAYVRDPRNENWEAALNPKVTGYYFQDELLGNQQEFAEVSWQYIKTCGIATGIFFFFKCLEAGPFVTAVFWAVMMGLVSGVPIGVIAWGILRLARLSAKAVKSLVMRRSPAGNRRYFLRLMREYNPEFGFEYFTARTVLLLKMILFSENPAELPFYRGEPVPEVSRLAEAFYEGILDITDCRLKDGIVCVTAEIYMKGLYYKEKGIKEKKNCFRVELCRRLSVPVEYSFNMRKMKCRSCGTVFDSMRNQACPCCKKAYEMENSDWVVNSCIMIK